MSVLFLPTFTIATPFYNFIYEISNKLKKFVYRVEEVTECIHTHRITNKKNRKMSPDVVRVSGINGYRILGDITVEDLRVPNGKVLLTTNDGLM